MIPKTKFLSHVNTSWLECINIRFMDLKQYEKGRGEERLEREERPEEVAGGWDSLGLASELESVSGATDWKMYGCKISWI